MTEMPYDLLIVDHANAAIRETAAEIGATHMRLIATGHNDDDRITLFALNAPGGELRVIETADDSVWEDDDPEVFFKMLEQYGVAK
jgi:tRNA(Ile)-lysidine synthase TilS/MesJ